MVHDPSVTGVLTFDFWGVITEVVVPTDHDSDHLAYYFGDYLTGPSGEAAVTVILETRGRVPYMTALPDSRRVIVRAEGGDVREVRTGEQTIGGQTPLPPFGLKPLAARFTTVHAASATHPKIPDAAVLIHGPSTVGKSSLILDLLTRGWKFLSDDTSPIDREGRVHPFTRPIGIRERTARRLGMHFGALPNARHHHTALGTTTSVHPNDLGLEIAPPSKVRWVVTLSRGVELTTTYVSGGALNLSLDIEVHQQRAGETVERFCGGGG